MPASLERTTTRRGARTETPQRARSVEAKNGVRAALIRAGRELMAVAGEEPISLRGIARHAGYSSGVIYRYFPDRDALFAAIRDSEINAFVDDLEVSLELEDDAERRLRLIADRSYDFSRQQIDIFGTKSLFLARPGYLANDDARMPQRDLAPSAARVHRLYERQIIAFVGAPTFKPLDLSLAVTSFMAAITGAVMLPAGSSHGDFPSGESVMHILLDSLFRGWR